MERGSYFTRVRSALEFRVLFDHDTCTTTESVVLASFSSILVLNHDWRPDRRYDMCDSWVGKIIDIRGNSPRNVRSSRSFRGDAGSLIAIGRSGLSSNGTSLGTTLRNVFRCKATIPVCKYQQCATLFFAVKPRDQRPIVLRKVRAQPRTRSTSDLRTIDQW